MSEQGTTGGAVQIALPYLSKTALPGPLGRDLVLACQPLPDNAGAGLSLRYTDVYREIREARSEDDPSLPRGEWDRPLKKADWPKVITLCVGALQTQSKDLQIAAWLAEAWLRRYGILGLGSGVALVEFLTDSAWHDSHPEIEDGDFESRISLFTWLRDVYLDTLVLHLPLFATDDDTLTLAQWRRALTTIQDSDDDQSVRQQILAAVPDEALPQLDQLRRAIPPIRDMAKAWAQKLDLLMNGEAPTFGRLVDMLDELRRASVSLIDGRLPEVSEPIASTPAALLDLPYPDIIDGEAIDAVPADQLAYFTEASQDHPPAAMHIEDSTIHAPASARSDAPSAAAPVATIATIASPAGIRDRAHAYELIGTVAEYLQALEPHSPTPYLLMRAASWGQLTLPELMQEILRDENDVARYFASIGMPIG